MQKLRVIIILILTSSLACPNRGAAQTPSIIPDNAESSQIKPIKPDLDKINGGAIRGINLFHSFQEFNIGDKRGAYFSNPYFWAPYILVGNWL